MKIKILKRKNPAKFRSCLLNSTANPANFHPNWAGLAVLFSRQILNGSQDFFPSLIIKNFFFWIWNHWEACPRIFGTYYFCYRHCVMKTTVKSMIGRLLQFWAYLKFIPYRFFRELFARFDISNTMGCCQYMPFTDNSPSTPNLISLKDIWTF